MKASLAEFILSKIPCFSYILLLNAFRRMRFREESYFRHSNNIHTTNGSFQRLSLKIDNENHMSCLGNGHTL